MVVRFVCVVCVPLCVRVFRVSRVCPGSPRCLFTGTSASRLPRFVHVALHEFRTGRQEQSQSIIGSQRR